MTDQSVKYVYHLGNQGIQLIKINREEINGFIKFIDDNGLKEEDITSERFQKKLKYFDFFVNFLNEINFISNAHKWVGDSVSGIFQLKDDQGSLVTTGVYVLLNYFITLSNIIRSLESDGSLSKTNICFHNIQQVELVGKNSTQTINLAQSKLIYH